jgi:hypothetical protein
MKIIDENENKVLSDVMICLKIDQLKELRDTLDDIINNSSHHGHLSDFEKSYELTICCYGKEGLDKNLNEEVRKLLYK